MADESLDLGLDPAHAALLRKEASKEPCFGGCGLSYEESNGGWFTFEVVDGQHQLAPQWFCDTCIQAVSHEGRKAGSGPTLN